jgi:hypothetical protein
MFIAMESEAIYVDVMMTNKMLADARASEQFARTQLDTWAYRHNTQFCHDEHIRLEISQGESPIAKAFGNDVRTVRCFGRAVRLTANTPH